MLQKEVKANHADKLTLGQAELNLTVPIKNLAKCSNRCHSMRFQFYIIKYKYKKAP